MNDELRDGCWYVEVDIFRAPAVTYRELLDLMTRDFGQRWVAAQTAMPDAVFAFGGDE